MTLKTIQLSNGEVIAVRSSDDIIIVYYEDEKEKKFKNMEELNVWVKNHFREELIQC